MVFVWYAIAKQVPRGLLDFLWIHVVPWVGGHVLHIGHRVAIPATMRASGDTTYDFVVLFCELVASISGALLWSLLDRKTPHYASLHRRLRFVVVFILAGLLFSYGLDKVIPIQFGTLSPSALSQRVGDLSPFDLLWTFMAGSKAYTILTGLVEVIAGILLLVPRLTLLGALIATAAMGNVFALNLAYGVPVKLISGQMLICCGFLVLSDSKLLVDFFVLNRVRVDRGEVLARTSRASWSPFVLRAVAGAMIFVAFLASSLTRYRKDKAVNADIPLQGVWVVDEFAITNAPSKPLFTDRLSREIDVTPGQDQWQELVFEQPHQLVIQLQGGEMDYVNISFDNAGMATITDDDDPSWKCAVAMRQIDKSMLTIAGVVNGNQVMGRFHRLDTSKMRLTKSQFHWITD